MDGVEEGCSVREENQVRGILTGVSTGGGKGNVDPGGKRKWRRDGEMKDEEEKGHREKAIKEEWDERIGSRRRRKGHEEEKDRNRV